jgi:hypothetical protein
MEKLLSDLQGNTLSFAFRQPVSTDDVADYYDVIKQPMGRPATSLGQGHRTYEAE